MVLSGAADLIRSISRRTLHETRSNDGGAPINRSLSHASQRVLSRDDGLTFPTLTSSALPTDTYQLETETGLISAAEAERELNALAEATGGEAASPHSAGSSVTRLGDVEKGKEDAKLVTWLENDPENPRNFSGLRKRMITTGASLQCFVGGFASAIVTGGLDPVRLELGCSTEVINLSVTMFVVGFGLGPLLFAPLSEIYGRRIIYLISMGLFTIFTIPCAVTHSTAVLIVFRFLSGTMASAPMTNAAGSISDGTAFFAIWDTNERGMEMAFFSSILFASPCLGPVIGGYISMFTSWRWIYYVLIIFSGVTWLMALFLLPESYAPVLLRRRAIAMRKETGDDTIMTEQERQKRPAADVMKETLLRPLVLLFTEPIMMFFSGYLCLIYSLLYGFFFSIPIVFAEGHGFNPGQTGLVFFAILIGIFIVGGIGCPIQEKYYQRKVADGDGSTPPETRLPLMMVGSIILPCGLFIFAFTSSPSTNYWGPIIACIPFGFSLVGIYISANTYLVDTYSRHAASAMSAKTFIRSLAGASVPMWIDYLYKGAGNEWAGAVFAFVALGMMPIPFVFYKYGATIRGRSVMATH